MNRTPDTNFARWVLSGKGVSVIGVLLAALLGTMYFAYLVVNFCISIITDARAQDREIIKNQSSEIIYLKEYIKTDTEEDKIEMKEMREKMSALQDTIYNNYKKQKQ